MIRIASPCPEKWERMTPVAGGSHCDKCCKTVVDFSAKTDAEIIGYFTANEGRRICGRFRASQVVRPKPKFRLSRFLAAALLAFGAFLFTSCGGQEEDLIGETIHIPEPVTRLDMQADSIRRADSIRKIREEQQAAAYKLSPEDSAKVEDSIRLHRNSVRDFN